MERRSVSTVYKFMDQQQRNHKEQNSVKVLSNNSGSKLRFFLFLTYFTNTEPLTSSNNNKHYLACSSDIL